MGGSSQDYYTTQNGNALIGSQTTLPQFLQAIAAASANPAQQTNPAQHDAAGAPSAAATGGVPGAATSGGGQASAPTGGGMASPSGAISQGSNVGGVRGDIADKAGTFANANAAVNPSLKNSMMLGSGIIGGIPFASEGIKALLGQPTSFDTPGPQLSAQQTQQIRDTYTSTFAMTNSPMAAQIAAQNQLAGFRAAGQPNAGTAAGGLNPAAMPKGVDPIGAALGGGGFGGFANASATGGISGGDARMGGASGTPGGAAAASGGGQAARAGF